MNNENGDIFKNLEFLVIKSRELLQEQLKSYDSANNKAGILISISALLLPIALSFISSTCTTLFIKILTIFPTALMMVALVCLLRVLMPKGIKQGFNFNQFDRLIDMSIKDILLFEIGANRDSYKINAPIVEAQNKHFKFGVKLIFCCAFILFFLVNVSFYFSN